MPPLSCVVRISIGLLRLKNKNFNYLPQFSSSYLLPLDSGWWILKRQMSRPTSHKSQLIARDLQQQCRGVCSILFLGPLLPFCCLVAPFFFLQEKKRTFYTRYAFLFLTVLFSEQHHFLPTPQICCFNVTGVLL